MERTYRAPSYLKRGEYNLELEIRQVRKALAEPNLTYALGFKEYLELQNRQPPTVYKRLHELRFVLCQLNLKDAKTATEEDIKVFILGLNRSDKAPISKRKVKLTLRSFYKWLFKVKGKDYPEIVSWFKIDGTRKLKLPDEMLDETDVTRLIEACKNERDRALVSLLWDSGARIGEILALRVKNIVFKEDELSYVMINEGKTGSRRTPLYFSIPYLHNYLKDSSLINEPEAPLFITIYTKNGIDKQANERQLNAMNYDVIRSLLSKLKKRSGLKKRLYAHVFRHSRATFYAARGMNEQTLKSIFGWSGGSQMASHYVHLSGADVNEQVQKANGIDTKNGKIKERPKPLTVKICFRCKETNPVTTSYCQKCGTNLDKTPYDEAQEYVKVKHELEELKQAFSMLTNSLDRETREKIMNLLEYDKK